MRVPLPMWSIFARAMSASRHKPFRPLAVAALAVSITAIGSPPAHADHGVTLQTSTALGLLVVEEKPKYQVTVSATATASHPCLIIEVGFVQAQVTRPGGAMQGASIQGPIDTPAYPAAPTMMHTWRWHVVLEPGDQLAARVRVGCRFEQPVPTGHYLEHYAHADVTAAAPVSVEGQASQRMSQAQKDEYRRAAKTFDRMAYVAGSTGLAVAWIPCGGCQLLGAGFGAMTVVFEGTSHVLDWIADDPPDFAFHALAPVRRPVVPNPDPYDRLGLGRPIKRTLRELIQTQVDAQVRLRAMIISIERAQGAELAAESGWEAQHLGAAAAHAEVAAERLDHMAVVQRRLAGRLRKARIATRLPARAAYRRLQRSLRAGKAPAPIVRALREWRLSQEQVARIRDAVLAVPARSLRTAASMLEDEELLATLRASAQRLRELAADIRANP